jgi:hypothetical protein
MYDKQFPRFLYAFADRTECRLGIVNSSRRLRLPAQKE